MLAAFLFVVLPVSAGALGYLLPKKLAWMPLFMAVAGCLVLTTQGEYSGQFCWFEVAGWTVQIHIKADSLSLTMLQLVQIVALAAVYFSRWYMENDGAERRYFAFLGLFVGAMNGLLIIQNLIGLYVFWEWVGVSSFWLIGFWRSETANSAAAQKAFLLNRIGDACLLAGIILIYRSTGSFLYPDLQAQPNFAVWLILGGCFAKSAQWPFSVWLPDAMCGPTPVSALIHAATMVAAGVYLVVRVLPWLGDSASYLAMAGALSAILAAFAATCQSDIKRLLAFSTISQLGLMMLAAGAGNGKAAIDHLFTHGFFKAGLFLGAGFFIHTLHHNGFDSEKAQHLPLISQIAGQFPIIKWAMIACLAALAGFPPFSGFFSKEAILNTLWPYPVWLAVFLIISLLTAYYSGKLFFYLIQPAKHTIAAKSSVFMSIPVVILAIGSVGWRGFSQDLHGMQMVLSLVVAIAGVALAYRFSLQSSVFASFFYQNALYDILSGIFVHISVSLAEFDRRIVDGIVNLTAQTVFVLGHFAAWFDRFVIDGMVNLFASVTGLLGRVLLPIGQMRLQGYFLLLALITLVLVFWVT